MSAVLSLVACWGEKAFQSFLCEYTDIIVLTSICPCVFSFGCYLLFLPFNVEGTVESSRKITNVKIINIYCLSSRYCEEYKEDMRKKNVREPEKEIRRDKRERCPGQARELRKRTTEGALDAETP